MGSFACSTEYFVISIDPVAGFASGVIGNSRRQIANRFYGGDGFHHDQANEKVEQGDEYRLTEGGEREQGGHHGCHHRQQNVVHKVDREGKGDDRDVFIKFAGTVEILLKENENDGSQQNLKALGLHLKGLIEEAVSLGQEKGAEGDQGDEQAAGGNQDPIGDLFLHISQVVA